MLDDALVQIAMSQGDPNARQVLAELVSNALRAVYAAIGACDEAGEYRDAMVVASMQIDEAITAAEALADDPEVSAASQRLSFASELASQSPLPARAWRLPGSAVRGSRLPASVGAPRLLDLTREPPHWAMGSLQELRTRPARQLRAFRNLLYCFWVRRYDSHVEVRAAAPRSTELRNWPESAVKNLFIGFGSFSAEEAYFEIEFEWWWQHGSRESHRVRVFPGRRGAGYSVGAGDANSSRHIEPVGGNGRALTPLAAASRPEASGYGLVVAPVRFSSSSGPSHGRLASGYLPE